MVNRGLERATSCFKAAMTLSSCLLQDINDSADLTSNYHGQFREESETNKKRSGTAVFRSRRHSNERLNKQQMTFLLKANFKRLIYLYGDPD